ncbi:MAG: prolyl oligopeptidase family serine peptidase, partial [Nonomuraea sp.]|nr:prolyl oligopeptidase family serine peptidase [Nonomuraea sp.]
GRLAAFLREGELWARSLEDGREWPLATGVGYAANPDYVMCSPLLRKYGLPHGPLAVAWSPDSRRLLTHRTDQSGVRKVPLVDALPAGGGAPEPLTLRQPYPGDEHVPRAELVVIDVLTGDLVRADAEPVPMSVMSPITMRWAWWAEDGSAAYYLAWPGGDVRTLELNRLDPATGAVTRLATETGPTRVEPGQEPAVRPAVRVLAGGEVLWYSQRDGWGHLSLDGAQLTSGAWAVREILHVDEERRVVYFTASGLVAADPYRRTVCRVGLDGTGFARVTDDDLDHAAVAAPGGGYFVDSASTVCDPPVLSVRGWDGRVLVSLGSADVSGLEATGWSPPERFRVTAADGVTDVYGVLYRPHGFDPATRYPVLDHLYPGPQTARVSPAFDPGFLGYDAEVAASLGYVVVALDGRGTPGRSKAFHDAPFADGLADHVAALEQLAAARPWMDLDRVGAFGHSGGGFATVRAMLEHPRLYRAGVAESGMHDHRYYLSGWGDAYEDDAVPSNVDLADRLQGELLLVHGGLDENASPYLTLRLAERLIAADKDFELLLVPRADHMLIGYERYVARRRWAFLARHLRPGG